MSTQPIKRSAALLPLSREHHFDLLLAWKIRKGLDKNVDSKRITAYITYLDENLMDTHFSDEEKLIFDLLPADDKMCRRARNEHEQIKKMIAEMKDEKNKKGAELFSQFADLVEGHVRYEERDLFPYLEGKLSISKLEELENVLSKKHDVFVDKWTDEFWSKQ